MQKKNKEKDNLTLLRVTITRWRASQLEMEVGLTMTSFPWHDCMCSQIENGSILLRLVSLTYSLMNTTSRDQQLSMATGVYKWSWSVDNITTVITFNYYCKEYIAILQFVWIPQQTVHLQWSSIAVDTNTPVLGCFFVTIATTVHETWMSHN